MENVVKLPDELLLKQQNNDKGELLCFSQLRRKKKNNMKNNLQERLSFSFSSNHAKYVECFGNSFFARCSEMSMQELKYFS